jgi:hypothetical protein
MNSDVRLSQLKAEFMRRIDETPNDLVVARYLRWDGPEPVPMVDYQVRYEGDSAKVLRSALNRDPTLTPLRRKLEFQIVEEARLLVVSLVRASELSR